MLFLWLSHASWLFCVCVLGRDSFILRFIHLKKTATSLSLDRLIMYRERLSPVCLAWDSMGLSNLFCGCIFSRLMCINVQLYEFTFFQELVISCSTAGFLGLLQVSQVFFILGGPNVSSVCCIPTVLWVDEIETSPLDSPPESQNFGHILHSSLSAWRRDC